MELNKLLAMKTKKKEPTRRMSLPDGVRKDRMPKIMPKKHNKSLGMTNHDIFEFDDSVADLDSFPVPEKTYLPKRKLEKNEPTSEVFFTANIAVFYFIFFYVETIKKSKLSKEEEGGVKLANRSSDVIDISDGEEESEDLQRQDGYPLEAK